MKEINVSNKLVITGRGTVFISKRDPELKIGETYLIQGDEWELVGIEYRGIQEDVGLCCREKK